MEAFHRLGASQPMLVASRPALRIGVIETGTLPPTLEARFGDYPRMVQRWLSPAMPAALFTPIRLERGEALGELAAHDGYVITGSRHGAYDRLPWIPALEAFIRAAGEAGVPVFGICFGHQIMAQAHGARVSKSERGWACGTQRYHVPGLPAGAAYHVFHQDQVLDVPADAECLGGNAFCPVGALRYARAGLSVQFHPEFETDFAAALLTLRAGVSVPQALASEARESLRRRPDNRPVALWVAGFFSAHTVGAQQAAAQ